MCVCPILFLQKEVRDTSDFIYLITYYKFAYYLMSIRETSYISFFSLFTFFQLETEVFNQNLMWVFFKDDNFVPFFLH